MTEHEDKVSRRAQRREQQKNTDDAGSSAPASEGAAKKHSEEQGGAAEEHSGAAEEHSGAAQERSEASEVESSSTPERRIDQIRDRNARLRAEAAEERRAKRAREKAAVAVPVGLDASERMDDLFVRSTHAAAGWIRSNFRWLQWVVVGGVLFGFGLQGYRYFTKSKAAKSSDALAVGLVAEGATIRPASENGKSDNPELDLLDPRPVYDSEQTKLVAAEQGYRKAIATHGKSGAGWLARLGLAGVLYDQQKWDEALEQYRAVRASELSKTDPDVLGRSLEGIGLALEGKGDKDGALQAFRELTNQEGAPKLATLGLYHQARILLAQGNKDKAKELATKAKERLDKDSQDGKGEKSAMPPRPGFVAESVKILLARIDPAAAQGPNVRNIADVLRDDPQKLQRMLEGLKQQGPTEPEPAPANSGGQP